MNRCAVKEIGVGDELFFLMASIFSVNSTLTVVAEKNITVVFFSNGLQAPPKKQRIIPPETVASLVRVCWRQVLVRFPTDAHLDWVLGVLVVDGLRENRILLLLFLVKPKSQTST